MWEQNSADTKVNAEVETGGAPGVGAEIPLKPTVTQAVPVQPMDDPMPENVDARIGHCDPMERKGPSGGVCEDCSLWERLMLEKFLRRKEQQ